MNDNVFIKTLQFRILSLQVIKRSLVILCMALFANSMSIHAQTINLPLVQDAFRNDAFNPGVAAPTPSMTTDYWSLVNPSLVTNYVGTTVSLLNVYEAQAALKFRLPQSSSVLSKAKLFFKVVDIEGNPTATVTLTDDNNWMQTEFLATSRFPTLSNPSVLLTDAPISSDGWFSLYLPTTALGAKIVPTSATDATLIITGKALTNNYFSFVADDDVSGDKAYLRITYKPQVQSVTVPANNTYKIGDVLTFTVSFDSLINVTGTPKLPITLNTGGTVRASYVSGSGLQNLIFRYTVASGDLDMDGVTVGNVIELNGGTIRSDNDDDAELNLYSVGTSTGVRINGILPAISSVSPTSGPIAGGTSVTITGVGFTDVTAVKFGSTNATSFAVNSSTQITAVSPAASTGTTDITITTPNGTSTTNINDKFTYVAAPTVITNAATSITSTGATLNGSVNAKNASTVVTFEYGLTTSYGTTVTADQSPVTGGTATPVSKAITGLTPNTTYYYRVIGINSEGTTNGGELTFSTSPSATQPSGTGTSSDPYLIASLDNLYWIADKVNDGTTAFDGEYFKQTVDIDASATSTWFAGKGWEPIGNGAYPFSGSYDGDGYTISNLYTNRPAADYIGLFGYCGAGTIKNLGTTNVSFTGGWYTAGLIGIATGSVLNCYSTGSIVGSDFSGGLIGYNQASVNNCYSTCSVSRTSSVSMSPSHYGGFIGFNDVGTIINCYATGTVTGGANTTNLGGFAGLNLNGTIINCYSIGVVNPAGGSSYGGFLGTNYGGTATGCFWDTQTSGQSASADGTGKTSAEMKTASTFTGWDFVGETVNGINDYWKRMDTKNNKYPYLEWQVLPFTAAISTTAISTFGATSATMGGNITADGGATVTERGVVYSLTDATPTIGETGVTKDANGTGIGTFNKSITGLSANTTYNVCAYATNSAGTSYGVVTNFTTLALPPTATTVAASSISSTAATLNGTVNANDAASAVTFKYGLTNSYGIIVTANQSPVTGTSATAVSYALTGLTPNTTYHYRVVGVNAGGTTNGGDMTFSTTDIAPNISYVTPQSYTVGTPIAALTPTNTGGTTPALTSAQVSTLAGSVAYGSADGLGTAASFNAPTFLAPDASGNIYVSDYGNNMIRKITPAGNVSTFIGTAVGLDKPAGIAIDPSGNVYVAENEKNRIRKITPEGVISTLAGSESGESGNTNDIGITAKFSGPMGLALDGVGNLYVTEETNNLIRKITPMGVVSTFAGSGVQGSTNGNGTSASFKSPAGVVIDPLGNLYVTEGANRLIRKISPTGDVTTFAGSGAQGFTNGNGTSASFNKPAGIAIDALGNLYVAESANNSIRKISPAGDVTTFAGNGSEGTDNGAGETARFKFPMGVIVDASGNIYVADMYNSLIRKITQTAYTISPALPAGLSFDGATGTISGTPAAASAATTYTVSAANSGGSSTATFSIAVKSPQTITFGTLAAKTYGDATFNLAATSTSGLAVSYSSDNTDVATVSGNTVTIVGAGTANITATQAGTAAYAPAANVTQQLTVNKKTLTVTAVADTKTYDGSTTSAVVPTVGTLASGDEINVAPAQTFDNANVGTAHVLTASGLTVKKGSVDMTNNYDISYATTTGTITKKALSVTATVDTKTYDGTTVSTAIPTVGTLATGDAINVAPTQAFDNAAIGTTHVLTPSGLTIKNGSADVTGNYDISYATATGTINKLGVTVTATADTKTYDATTVSTAIPTVGTLATGDAINVAPTQAFDNAAVGTTHVLTPSGLTIKNGSADVTGNYDISYATAIGTINKLGVTVTAVADTKIYDGTTGSTVVPSVGTVAAGDAINGAPTQAFDNATVGTTHVLTASGLTIKNGSADVTGNYDISYATAIGTINKLGVTVTATADTKTYDGTTVSTAIPTVGILATGDAINVAPAQVFDNAAVGTAHVLTASGLIIKNGSTDVTGNYDISYATATGTINKLGVTVTAVTDTKTYDGTTVSTAIPTVGTLATGDAINGAPTQAFDNATVGTTHVLTASGLTIKNGSADVTGNYDISYATATGTINKLGVTVTAVADTKTYDGTTVSAAIPTVGTLATGDAINVAPAQVFDNASVGTTHVLTASGLTIKNGSADVTGNYDISYARATGSITAKALTITTPAVTLSKVHDGNTLAAVTAGTLSGVVAGDAGKVTVAASASYDNATVGANKTITVIYTLGGSSAGNYSAPANYIATGAEIYSATIALQPLSDPTPNPANTGLVLSYSVVTGGPTQYQITFETRAVSVGFQNVSYTALVTTGTDGSISITVPKGTRPGKYKGTLKMRNDSGVESTAYDFVITVNIPTEYIAVKYNRVLVLDNSTRIFKAYQWFKNGVAIEGATKQFYRDPKGLVGTYSMQATDIDGEIIYSFPKELNIPIAQKVTAYPSLVRANQTCTVEITDEAMELDLKGAELSVYSSQGIRVYHTTNVEKLNTVKLPAMDGTYSGRVTTTDGQSFLFKVIVAN